MNFHMFVFLEHIRKKGWDSCVKSNKFYDKLFNSTSVEKR